MILMDPAMSGWRGGVWQQGCGCQGGVRWKHLVWHESHPDKRDQRWTLVTDVVTAQADLCCDFAGDTGSTLPPPPPSLHTLPACILGGGTVLEFSILHILSH